MESASIIVGITLGIFSLGILAYPFFKYKQSIVPSQTYSENGLGSDIDTIYEAIKTLQLEYQLNRITEKDFIEQLDSYRIQAANLLRTESQNSSDIESFRDTAEYSSNRLEKEILLARGLISEDASNPKL
ncbi:MAG: hypothetical protein CM1200mP35_04700 [Chloroflexota bacterium]|nr:MAG: hypothetical protein CM1200mP35_04700 [Chloroflexota bacterium]